MNDNKSMLFVGSRQFQVKDKANKLVFLVLVQYPRRHPSSATPFGPYLMDVSSDAKIID
jgi:hypothetical protein